MERGSIFFPLPASTGRLLQWDESGATFSALHRCPASSGRPRQPQCAPPSRAGMACSLVRPYGMPSAHAGTRLCGP